MLATPSLMLGVLKQFPVVIGVELDARMSARLSRALLRGRERPSSGENGRGLKRWFGRLGLRAS